MELGKMVSPRSHLSRFTNRYGEQWEFEYNLGTREGVLRGSDVDWHEYPVVGGRAIGLALNDEEIQWLREAWRKAVCGQ